MKDERERAIATDPRPVIDNVSWAEGEVQDSTPEKRSGLRWRLALFAYRGQLGPTKHEDWRNFLPKKPR